MKRVVFVEGNTDGTVGGSYFSLLYLAAGLDRRHFEPVVIFAASSPMQQTFRDRGVESHVVPIARPVRLPTRLGRHLARAANFFRGWIMEPVRLALYLRRMNASLVHLNNSIISNHAWMLASFIARIPCITHERGINSSFSRRSRLLASRLDAVVCISGAVRDNFVRCGVATRRLVTIFNGLDASEMSPRCSQADARRELGVGPSAYLVGMVGNIKPWKGQEILLEAAALLSKEFPELACVFIGDTSPAERGYRDFIDQRVRDLGLERRVTITGFRRDVASVAVALDVQVHASVAPEPFGRVLLEAMALRKPLIASRGGAVPEIVVDGETGLLFEPGNASALAACIRRFLTEPEMASRLGESGYQRLLSAFSIQRNIELTQDLYRELLH